MTTNRKQCRYLNGIQSSIRAIEFGVPQGSCLGPLLFLIFVNDHVVLEKATPAIFADDTGILVLSNDVLNLQKLLNEDIQSLVNWLEINKVT